MANQLIPCDTLLTASVLVSQNDTRDILREAALAITDSRITDLGPSADLTARYQPATRLDLGDALVLPGLINTHTHAAMTLFRGLCDDAPLASWLTDHIWPAEAKLTPEAVRLGTLLACAEMLASGTTCFCDAYFFSGTVAEAADASGMRAVIGQGVFDSADLKFKTSDQALDAARELADKVSDQPRLRPALFAHAVYTCTTRTLERCVELSRERDLLLATHAVETARENDDCHKAHGLRVIPYLERLGFLGPRTLLAHGVALDTADITTLAAHGTAVSHCPKSNMKLGSGIAPVPALRTAGVTVSLGTDGAASNNALNLFSEMSATALLHKVAAGDPTAQGAQATLDMATRDGGLALGWPELGRLTVDGPADLCALDLTRPALASGYSPVSDAVYAASGGEVVLTMVAGQVLYRNGRYTTLDYPKLRQEFREAARRLTGR